MTKRIHTEFVEIASGISVDLHHAISRTKPLRLKKRNDRPLPEVLCRAVAGQQLSTQAASTIWGRVVERAGSQSLIEHIAATKQEELRACGLSNAKAKAMKAIAEADHHGRLDITSLAEASHVERSEVLTEIWGIGQWTADMISIFYFGEKDVWPDKDVTVWKTLERLTGKRRKTLLTAARFAPNRSHLAVYMYHFADVGIPTK